MESGESVWTLDPGLITDAIQEMLGYSLMPPGSGQAYFWSGRLDGVGMRDTAAAVARSNGGYTLESWMGELGVPQPTSMPEWERASTWFANQVSGVVTIIYGDHVRDHNVMETLEAQALMSNSSVTQIVALYSSTGQTHVVYGT